MNDLDKSPENVIKNARKAIQEIIENKNNLSVTDRALKVVRIVGHVEGMGAALDWPDEITSDFTAEAINFFK